jgi:Protein of unknown function (DUF1553)/Protein of unknown function (DUF1549)/Planctomycete cytochrome C/NPCBM/NEW2 domain
VNPDFQRVFVLLAVVAVGVLRNGCLCAAEPKPDAPEFFEQIIRPVLHDRCVGCHGANQQRSELRLDAKQFAFRGGGNGPVIVSGKSADSLLWQRVSSTDDDERMPPNGKPLTAEQLASFKAWIDAGAVWTETAADRAAAADTRREHWAWQPVHRTPPPQDAAQPEAHHPIDAFLRVKLAAAGLTMSPGADRRTLIRRLSFDLLGLPPAPDEVDAFLNDRDPQAYERLVDRLLDSPHFGERWARHWLDVAHYADTHGFERDQRRDNAWPYRDWVIRAFNSDMPYDDFLRDQIAGDVLRPDDPAAVIATGFLAAGPWDFVGQAETPSPLLKRLARADDLDDMITQVLTAACGVTINCARCHDHKLDPISQREYYSLWAVFAGVKRGDRDVSAVEVRDLAARRQSLNAELQRIRTEQARRSGRHRDLADIVGGGDGLGGGKPGDGIDPVTGKPQSAKRGFLEGATPNVFAKSTVKFVDGVVIPDFSPDGTPIASTGLRVKKPPRTSGQAWDAIRFGPVNSQFSTKLDGIDYNADGHTLLSLHANAAITFDLAALREAGAPAEMKFTSTAGYFGQTPKFGASFAVYVDGEAKFERKNIGRDDGGIAVEIMLPATARFLTLMATDGGNGISHDQICFADAWLTPAQRPPMSEQDELERVRLQQRRVELETELASLPAPSKVYAVISETPPPIKLLKRGDPEQPGDDVVPASLECIANLNPQLATADASEGERRKAFAAWVTSPANPLTRRVIVNRLWNYHFGTGLVDTPSDFGLGGGRPSHPELLDWLADEMLAQRWSLKSIHRLIYTSAAYRQQSVAANENSTRGRRVDAGNRLLWRMNPRRLDAESLRDAVLAVSGRLNRDMFGPGYRDFEYKEEYAPVYRYITPDSPDLWRRSVYRFVVRTTTHPFLTTLDCPSPANLIPTRNVTTTPLQSLALLNNEFMLRQSGAFADRVRAETGTDAATQVERAFRLAFERPPSPVESAAARTLVESRGLPELCRMLLNANEFVYVD